MKRVKGTFLLWFILLAGYIFCIPAVSANKAYQVGILDFPPYSVIEKSGAYKGILVDLMERVLTYAGIPYTVKGFPQKRLFSNLSTGKTDIYMGIKGVPFYEDKVLFSDFAVAELDLRVYVRKGTPLIKTIKELKDKRVIVIMGYGYGGLVRFLKDPANHITVDPSHTHTLAFRKLKAKRADYILDYRCPASITIKEVGIEGIQSHSISKMGIYFIVSKKTPGAAELMERIVNAYKSLKADGQLSDMLPILKPLPTSSYNPRILPRCTSFPAHQIEGHSQMYCPCHGPGTAFPG